MKNAFAIGDLAQLMGKNCEAIGTIVVGMGNAEQSDNDALVSSYQEMLLNLLENVQHTVIAMTQLVTEATGVQEDHGDGSVFMPGELDDDMGGEKNVEHPGAEEEEK